MANIREAFEYAAKNPNSDFAKNLAQLVKSGSLDVEAQKNGIDLTPFKPSPTPVEQQPRSSLTPEQKMQRDTSNAANFIGGNKLAQGIGQSIAQHKNAKALDQAQTQATDIQTQLLQRIKQGREAGADTKRLEDALKVITENIGTIGQETGQVLNPNDLTNKQVLGDALQLATTVGAGKIVGGASKLVGTGTGVLAGAGRGAVSGALSGATIGALSGTAQGIKDGKTASDIAKSAGKSAVLGGIGGAVVGTVAGGVSGKINANQIKKENFATELVSPKLSPSVKEQAIKEGRVTEPGVFNPSKITPSKRDIQLADAVRDVVSPKKTILQNTNAIDSKIRDINNGVKQYVQENKVPFNMNQLRSKLNVGKEELNLIFASDSNAEKTYNAVVKEFMKHVEAGDTKGLLDARQNFDKIPAIKKLLESQGLGENVKREIVLTARTKANEYIAELLPEGNAYRADILRESKMIEALGNIAEKSRDMIGANKLQLLTRKYPILKWIVGAGAGAASVGVGGAIIGSLD